MTDWLTLWWVWLSAALVLGIAEVLVPGFVFLGFAIGAFGVSMLLLATDMDPSVALLFFLFAGLSLLGWLILRRVFKLPGGQVKRFDHDIND